MHHVDMRISHMILLCVDLYSWVGEEEGYDGCVAIESRHMQRCLATLQRDRGGDDERAGEIVAGTVDETYLLKILTYLICYLH